MHPSEMMLSMPESSGCLSVVMPAFDEQTSVAEALRRVLDSPFVGEVVVVDDASRDRTAAEVLAFDDPRVRLIQQPVNLGKGAALRRGFREARLPYVIVQDADLEYDPSDYHQMMEPLLTGKADVVFGSRFSGGMERRVLYFWHSLGNKALTLLSNALTNLNLTDMGAGYKAFRREVIQSIDLEEDRFGFDPEVTAKVARGQWRVHEVSISYNGRTYAQGKKIVWSDGLRAAYCTVRYSSLWPTGPKPTEVGLTFRVDEELADTLHVMDSATNYADWIGETFQPYLTGTVAEIGAGSGTMTERIRRTATTTIATDLSDARVRELRERFAGAPDVEVVQGDAASTLSGRAVDAVVMINVLEHLADDVGELTRIRHSLQPGGHVAVFVPAHRALYSQFDQRVGHFRRYSKATLVAALADAGFDLVKVSYFNRPGAVAWWVLARALGRAPTGRRAVQLFDRRVVPVIRHFERNSHPGFGQSLIVVGRRPTRESPATSLAAAPPPVG